MEGVASVGTITRIDPPRLLAYSFEMGESKFEVTFELKAEGGDVILTILQSPVADSQGKAAFASGGTPTWTSSKTACAASSRARSGRTSTACRRNTRGDSRASSRPSPMRQ
jgi:uncharacterized protein YndB with AHSA1/START domain